MRYFIPSPKDFLMPTNILTLPFFETNRRAYIILNIIFRSDFKHYISIRAEELSKNYQSYFLMLIILFIIGTSSLVSTSVIYQSGDTAILPCDISVPSQSNNQDELVLVMWYREDVRSPIYSIGKNFNEY